MNAQRHYIKVEIPGIVSPPHDDVCLTVILDHPRLNHLSPFAPEKIELNDLCRVAWSFKPKHGWNFLGIMLPRHALEKISSVQHILNIRDRQDTRCERLVDPLDGKFDHHTLDHICIAEAVRMVHQTLVGSVLSIHKVRIAHWIAGQGHVKVSCVVPLATPQGFRIELNAGSTRGIGTIAQSYLNFNFIFEARIRQAPVSTHASIDVNKILPRQQID